MYILNVQTARNRPDLKRKFFLEADNEHFQLFLVQETLTGGQSRRLPFIQSVFHPRKNIIVSYSADGCIYLLDLETATFWLLKERVKQITTIEFVPFKTSEVVAGTSSGRLLFIDTDQCGHIFKSPEPDHTSPVKKLEFSHQDTRFISISENEAFIWDYQTQTKILELLFEGAKMKIGLIAFIPQSSDIVSSLNGNYLEIWRSGENLPHIVSKSFWQISEISVIAFTRDGQFAALGGLSPDIALFKLSSWTLDRLISIPNTNEVKQMEFLMQPFDYGANKLLAVVTPTNFIVFNVQQMNSLRSSSIPSRTIREILVLHNSALLNDLYEDQMTNINDSNFTSSTGFNSLEGGSSTGTTIYSEHDIYLPQRACSILKDRRVFNERNQEEHYVSVLKTSDYHYKKNLRKILQHYGEFPERYRHLIWRACLDIPFNNNAYKEIVLKGNHPSFKEFLCEDSNWSSFHKHQALRLASNLAHWCSFLSQVPNLPNMVIGLCIVIKHNPHELFEIAATIFQNHCLNWFDMFPQAPQDILSSVEIILKHQEPKLHAYFQAQGVSAEIYAWSLMSNLFTSVLNLKEWFILWDNALCHGNSFLICFTVAYSIECKRSILGLGMKEDIEKFYTLKKNISLKTWIKKTYRLYDSYKNHITVSQFNPLTNDGLYEPYNGISTEIVDVVNTRLDEIKTEEEKLLKEEIRLKETLSMYCFEKNLPGVQAELRGLEEKYLEHLYKEEERIAQKNANIAHLKNTLKSMQIDILHKKRLKELRETTTDFQAELDKIVKHVDHQMRLESIKEGNREVNCENNFVEIELPENRSEISLLSKNEVKDDQLPNFEGKIIYGDAIKNTVSNEEGTKEEPTHLVQLSLLDNLTLKLEMETAKAAANELLKTISTRNVQLSN